MLVCSITACAAGSDGVDDSLDTSGTPACSGVLADYGHGEANYEAAMLEHPTCIGDEGTETMYYEFLDDRGIKYPGWPN
jgi:hypothetical protein